MIHPTAIVSPDAQVGDGAEIGPFAVIGEGVVLGPGCRVGAHAILEGPATFGEENQIFPHAQRLPGILDRPPGHRRRRGRHARG
jgi:UDP-N-acetylglucosamine acyltransferase